MVFDLSQITGIGDYTLQSEPTRDLYLKDGRTFLVMHRNTIEVRIDPRLGDNLKEKFESVMESRYYGHNGVEIVLAGQLSHSELEDLVRLSYNLT